jgi:hypothetical protein
LTHPQLIYYFPCVSIEHLRSGHNKKKVLESLTLRKGKRINLFFILKDGGNDKYYYTEQNKSNHIAEQASFTEQINAKSPKNKYGKI